MAASGDAVRIEEAVVLEHLNNLVADPVHHAGVLLRRSLGIPALDGPGNRRLAPAA
jgi:hypothetical protein